MSPRPPFFVADLDARGELRAMTEYCYDDLQQIPGAAELIGEFSGALYRSAEEFETALWASPGASGATPPTEPLEFRWRASSNTAGIATLRCAGELASLSLLVSGVADETDRLTLAAYQQHLLRELHDSGTEPAFTLLELRQRPLVATVNFQSPPDPPRQAVAALADRCFAASYFRFQGLA